MICICLQSCGANPAISDGEGRTALHYAVTKQTFECCQVLLECLPKLADTKDGKGRIPLHLAVTAKGNKYVCVCVYFCLSTFVSLPVPLSVVFHTLISLTLLHFIPLFTCQSQEVLTFCYCCCPCLVLTSIVVTVNKQLLSTGPLSTTGLTCYAYFCNSEFYYSDTGQYYSNICRVLAKSCVHIALHCIALASSLS